MLTKNVIFMSVQPDVPYFHWQVEVMIHNFMKVGINPNNIEVLWSKKSQTSAELIKLINKYPYVRFFVYDQAIQNNFGYIPILRPDALEQHFTNFPNLRGETILYHDSDIIFRKLPDFDSMYDDLYWYFSDTVSYIGANYIKSKSTELFTEMCNLVNVDPQLVESIQENSGGAQSLIKGANAEFWKNVKNDALALYKYMADREVYERSKLTAEELKTYNPIQKWCADMWSLLWNCLKIGAQPRISPEMSFSWGTSSLEDYEKHNIMHNAGVTGDKGGTLFYKGDFINKNPFDADFSKIDQNTASAKYVDAILYAKSKRNEIV